MPRPNLPKKTVSGLQLRLVSQVFDVASAVSYFAIAEGCLLIKQIVYLRLQSFQQHSMRMQMSIVNPRASR